MADHMQTAATPRAAAAAPRRRAGLLVLVLIALAALILVYTAQGLPLAIFILSEFMRTVSDDLKNAGRVDGLSEYRIFFTLVLPLVRPAMATVAVFTMIPIWNDLWFPLILAPGEATKTVTLGAQLFLGQYVTNWEAVLAAAQRWADGVSLEFAFRNLLPNASIIEVDVPDDPGTRPVIRDWAGLDPTATPEDEGGIL